MTSTMTMTVKYSRGFSFLRGSHTASRRSSNPRSKMSTPTIMTGMKPISDGPTSMTRKVNAASRTPASRVLPPERMKNRLLE